MNANAEPKTELNMSVFTQKRINVDEALDNELYMSSLENILTYLDMSFVFVI